MDPFSITLGVVTLATLASKAGIELKKLRSGAAEASNNVNAMLSDLKSLKAVLDLIEDGFEELDSMAPLTGYIGAHFSALKTTLADGCDSIEKLGELLVLVNKDVKILDAVRRERRLKEANDQIVLYRQEIQAYKDALQLSLQSVIFFQQTTIKQDTAKLLKNSDSLHHDLSRLAANLDIKLTALEMILVQRHKASGTNTNSVKHLQHCVRTAATVVTSASTAMGDEMTDQSQEKWDFTSELGWLVDDLAIHSDLTLDWLVTQNTQQYLPQGDLAPSSKSYAGDSEHRTTSQMPLSSVSHPRLTVTESAPWPASQSNINDATVSPSLQMASAPPSTENLSTNGTYVEEPPLKKRRNFSLSRFLSPRPKHTAESRTTSDKNNPLCMNDLVISDAGEVRIKWTFVGDGACGKTCFLIATSKGAFPEVYVPTVFENYVADFRIDGVDFECALWDTAGQEDYDRLRPLSYTDTHVYCICFAIDWPESLDDVREKWRYEIEHYKRKRDPVFLLGFKKDLRYDPKTIADLQKYNQVPVTAKEGEEVAQEIGALKYFECSSIRQEGTKEIFKSILGMILEASPKLRKKYNSGKWRRKTINMLQPK